MSREEIKVIFLAASGQIVEFYDFIVFVLLAGVISSHFFTGSIYAKYMYLFGVFALGYIARPLGGMIFGHYGDTLGRKKTFIATIFITSVATFCIGLVPDYQTIGLSAPAILVFLRMIQGVSVGGELPGAISFVYEYMPENRRTLGTSIIYSTTAAGYLLASSLATAFYCFFSDHQMAVFGWRLAFFCGGIFGFIICILRGKMSDTPVFRKLLENNQVLRYPLMELLRRNFRNCLLGMLIPIFVAYGTMFMVTLPNLLSSYLHYYSHPHILKINTFSIVAVVVCTVMLGYIIDRWKLNIYLFFSIACFVITGLIFPLFIMLQTQNLIWLLFVYAVFAATFSMAAALEFHIIAELFPATIEYSGLGLTINVGTILGIGLVPVLSTFLLQNTMSLYSIAYALVIMVASSGIAGLILFFRPPSREKLRELDEEIRALYSLCKRFESEGLSPKEEQEFRKKLDEFAENLIETRTLFKSSKISNGSSNAFIEGELSKLKVNDIQSLTHEQQQELYQRCKQLLKINADNPETIMYKYQKLLESNVGNKYYTYFYTRLIIKEYVAMDRNKQLTAKDINTVLEQYEEDIKFFKQYK